MKNYLLIALLCLGLLPTRAQKIIEKHFTFAPNSFVSMNFQISDSIRIVTWKKNEVYVKSSINVNDNKNNDDYKMVFGESGNVINISAKLEMNRNGKDSCNCCCSTNGGKGYNNGHCNTRAEIFHEVYVPEHADFSVETINGNIMISGNTAEIRARSISGFIDLAITPERKADLKMHTITGTMYTNVEMPTSRRIKQVGGGSVSAQLNGGGGKPIDIETISGNIFFRKEG